MVTVSSVSVSKDFSYADVYVSFLDKDSQQDIDEAVNVLTNAAGFLRSTLAKELKLRVMPKLRFHYDATLAEAPRLSALIDKAVKQDQARHQHDADNGESD